MDKNIFEDILVSAGLVCDTWRAILRGGRIKGMEFPWPSHGVVKVRGSRQAQGHLFKIGMTQRHEITSIKHTEDG